MEVTLNIPDDIQEGTIVTLCVMRHTVISVKTLDEVIKGLVSSIKNANAECLYVPQGCKYQLQASQELSAMYSPSATTTSASCGKISGLEVVSDDEYAAKIGLTAPTVLPKASWMAFLVANGLVAPEPVDDQMAQPLVDEVVSAAAKLDVLSEVAALDVKAEVAALDAASSEDPSVSDLVPSAPVRAAAVETVNEALEADEYPTTRAASK